MALFVSTVGMSGWKIMIDKEKIKTYCSQHPTVIAEDPQTGMREACGETSSQIANKILAVLRLKRKIERYEKSDK